MTTRIIADAPVKGFISPVHSPSKAHKGKVPIRNTLSGDFNRYEIGLLLITQLSYFPVAATMLCASFYESVKDCPDGNSTLTDDLLTADLGPKVQNSFVSPLLEWGIGCDDDESIVPTILSTSLMIGALLGAFIAGWLADTHGRRPVIRNCLLLICFGNAFFALMASVSWVLAAFTLLILGAASGGYMVTNLVLLVEWLESPRSRLLAVSLNGWSISMVFVAVLAYGTMHWRQYHMCNAFLSVIAAVAVHWGTAESARWLAGMRRMPEARAAAIAVARKNGFRICQDLHWFQLLGFTMPHHELRALEEDEGCKLPDTPATAVTYGYADLFKHRTVRTPLIVLSYCFIVSSIVSFGFYFNMSSLPGSHYVNMALMGLLKFTSGLIPFLLPAHIGRRPIVLTSVGIAVVAATAAALSHFFGVSEKNWTLAALALAISASLDPTWKINHLYSAELFPTVVRNMARGFCNVAARLGSAVAPLIVYLRVANHVLPYIVFSVLLAIQWVLVLLFLPETKDLVLSDVLEDSNEHLEEEDENDEETSEKFELVDVVAVASTDSFAMTTSTSTVA